MDVRPVPWWLRAYLVIAIVQGILVMGISGLFFPAEVFIPIDVSPLNARFVGALYMAGGIGVLLSALAHTVAETRIFVIGFGMIAIIATLLTFAYWDDFTANDTPWIWTATYILDATVAPILIAVLQLWRFVQPGRHRFSLLFAFQAVVMGILGLLLVFAPDTAIDHWPWALTVVLARLYGAFFLTFALGAALAAWEAHVPALRAFVVSSFALMVLSMVAVIPHLDRFTGTDAKLAWFGGFGLGAMLLAVPLFTLWVAPMMRSSGRPQAESP